MFTKINTKYSTCIKFFNKQLFRSNKRILFINPKDNFFEPANPIAILDIAPYLRKHGYKVDVCNYPEFPLKSNYDHVGVSCIGNYNGEIFEQLKVIQTHFPLQKIIVGGKWTTTITEEDKAKLVSMGIDIEAEKAEIAFTHEEIDWENYPSWNQSDFDKLYTRDQLMTSRGCPFHCNFCNNTEKKVVYFAPSRTVKNIKLLLQKRDDIFFCDDVFVSNYEHAKSIYDACIANGIDIRGKNRFFVHVNKINEQTLELISLFKPRHVEIGIESGSQLILDKMNKRTKVEQIRKVIPLLAQHTSVCGLWLIGFPYETRETLEESYMLLKELSPYIDYNWVSHYIPLYGTVGYKMAIATQGTFLRVKNNTQIAFVPQGLTEEILIDYRKKMMEIN